MKLSKTFSLLGIGLVTIFVVGMAYKLFMSYKSRLPVSVSDLSYSLSPTSKEFKVGDKFTVPVYLSGKGADRATAIDIKFKYDSTKLKLTGATPGTFYDKYITIKWEPAQGWFALATSPTSSDKVANISAPVLTLEFTAVGRSSSTTVSTDTSTAYVANTKTGFSPTSGSVNFTVK